VAWPASRLADLDRPEDLERLHEAAGDEAPCAPTS